MRECQISAGKNTGREICSLGQSGEVNTTGLSLKANNVFWVDYGGIERLKQVCPSYFALQEADKNQKGQMGFV